MTQEEMERAIAELRANIAAIADAARKHREHHDQLLETMRCQTELLEKLVNWAFPR